MIIPRIKNTSYINSYKVNLSDRVIFKKRLPKEEVICENSKIVRCVLGGVMVAKVQIRSQFDLLNELTLRLIEELKEYGFAKAEYYQLTNCAAASSAL